MENRDIVIIGGGIIGCALALRLAEEKLKVTVLERGEPGREASWAAAGMLAPTAEEAHQPGESELAAASARLYPTWVQRLRELSGIDAGYRSEGTLLVAFTPGEAEHLRRLPGEWLAATEARREEPALSERVVGAAYLPSDVQVDNRRLLEAVVEAARRAGVEFCGGVNVAEVVVESGRAVGVRVVESARLAADMVVNAAGCWAGQLGELGRRLTPTRPIRGQMIALESSGGSPILQHVMRSARGYIVPRGDRLILGSTLEDTGYDKSLAAAGLRGILAGAMEMVPALGSAPFLEAWAGLRPDTPDHLPILGATDVENYFVATGHYRNGMLLAPITAELVGDVILGRKPSLGLEPFSAFRFARR
ncbi:MAG: glycine oxidase ThiO [Acidobacteria bacterium]|nr:glycine oxidase ThiO [Acidobacteriota bacterium]